MMSLGLQIRQKSSFNCSDKSFPLQPGVSSQNWDIQIRTYDSKEIENYRQDQKIQPRIHLYIVVYLMINMCCSDFIIVLCNNRNNCFSANGPGRDPASGPWMKTSRSGLRPLVAPLACRHTLRRWEQRNKEVIKINQAPLSGARSWGFDLCCIITQWHHFWQWGGNEKGGGWSQMRCSVGWLTAP